jgi:putative transposase
MTEGLKRYQQSKQTHFVTFSCYRRMPRLHEDLVRGIFVESLERTRRSYCFRVYGYVVMPEHVHLLVSEPDVAVLATAIQALKISAAQRQRHYHPEDDGTFWQKRYYDHNVRSYQSFVEKLRYIHRNPVARGLVEKPDGWQWSSFRHYAMGEVGAVEIESRWTADRRNGRTPELLQIPDDQTN